MRRKVVSDERLEHLNSVCSPLIPVHTKCCSFDLKYLSQSVKATHIDFPYDLTDQVPLHRTLSSLISSAFELRFQSAIAPSHVRYEHAFYRGLCFHGYFLGISLYYFMLPQMNFVISEHQVMVY